MLITDLVYIDATGYHYADYPTFRQYYVEKLQEIYGADVYLEDDSQDGQWVSVRAQAAYNSAVQGAAAYNSYPPSSAQGTGLSRNVRINGIERQAPSYSTAIVTLVGVVGTVITNGVVKDTLEQKWDLPVSVTIPAEGTIDVTATAQEIGDVTADASTITTIFTPTQGWQTVTNGDAATPGAPVESDAALRLRQAQSVALPSLTVFQGTLGAVANVTGVTKLRGYENDTETTDGNGIPAHSICVVVAGGDSTDIANAIEVKKTPGTSTFGDTTVLVFDSNGMPINIKFQRADSVTIGAEITITTNDGWSSDYIPLIQEAVAAVINAGRIGDPVLYTKLFAPAYLNGTPEGLTFDVELLEINKDGGAFDAANIVLAFDENPVCDPETDIEVIVT